MLAIGTGVVPLFESVTTTGVDDVAPTPVVGKARPTHVMTNGDGVTVVGVVGVLLEQPPASAATNEASAKKVRRWCLRSGGMSCPTSGGSAGFTRTAGVD